MSLYKFLCEKSLGEVEEQAVYFPASAYKLSLISNLSSAPKRAEGIIYEFPLDPGCDTLACSLERWRSRRARPVNADSLRGAATDRLSPSRRRAPRSHTASHSPRP